MTDAEKFDALARMVGDRIIKLRVEKRLTQKEFAQSIGASGSTVSYWEQGIRIPTVETIQMLCEFFNVNADYLLGFTETRLQFREEPRSVASPLDTVQLDDTIFEKFKDWAENTLPGMINAQIRQAFAGLFAGNSGT